MSLRCAMRISVKGIHRQQPIWDAVVTLPRRHFLRLAGSAVLTPAVVKAAAAIEYPARPVRLVVGFAAGGSLDIVARLIGRWLAEQLGQPFVIENRLGAGSSIAAEAVVRAAPDGYTLILASVANTINAAFYDNLSFDFAHDIEPVGAVISTPLVMEVNPSVPARSVPEFIAYARAHPGEMNMASTGSGGATHISGELFKMMAGIDLTHVPYRGGGPALTDLLAGQVQVMFDLMPSSIGYVRSGMLRALAVTTATRSEALPDLPVVADFVPGYESSAWQGIGAPKGTPQHVINKLNRAINAALADPELIARVAELGSTPMPMSQAAFATLITSDTERWARVVKVAGIKPE
jgi:tripartite-type tricarboxylate transporter receptor subunit TctC